MPNVDHTNYVRARCQSPAFTTSKFHLKPIYVEPSVFVDPQKSALGISLVLSFRSTLGQSERKSTGNEYFAAGKTSEWKDGWPGILRLIPREIWILCPPPSSLIVVATTRSTSFLTIILETG